MISSESKIQRIASHTFCDEEEEIVLLHSGTGAMIHFGPVGSRIWRLIETPMTIEQISAALQGDSEMTPEDCYLQVVEFVGRLLDRDLAQAVDPVH